jgi:hypothetical protein
MCVNGGRSSAPCGRSRPQGRLLLLLRLRQMPTKRRDGRVSGTDGKSSLVLVSQHWIRICQKTTSFFDCSRSRGSRPPIAELIVKVLGRARYDPVADQIERRALQADLVGDDAGIVQRLLHLGASRSASS